MVLTNNSVSILCSSQTSYLMQLSRNKLYIINIYNLVLIYVSIIY